MHEAETRGEIPTDLQGALELAQASGDTIAAEVYAEALAGKVAVEDVSGLILAREEDASV